MIFSLSTFLVSISGLPFVAEKVAKKHVRILHYES